MKIKVYEFIDPNDTASCYESCTTTDQRDSVACFIAEQQIWRNKLSLELGCLPHHLSWHEVQNTGTDIDVCDVTGASAMCNTWELKP